MQSLIAQIKVEKQLSPKAIQLRVITLLLLKAEIPIVWPTSLTLATVWVWTVLRMVAAMRSVTEIACSGSLNKIV